MDEDKGKEPVDLNKYLVVLSIVAAIGLAISIFLLMDFKEQLFKIVEALIKAVFGK